MLDRLKSLFIIEDEEPNKKPPAKEVDKPEQKSADSPAKSSRSTGSNTPSTGKVRSKFTDILFGAMEKNNQQGFDYLEFKQALQNLAKMPMDEGTRYKSAFAMAQTMKVSPEKLIESAQFYVQVLDGEKGKFQQAVENQEDRNIRDRKATIQQLDKTIQEKTEMIEQLKKDIAAAQQERAKLEKKMTEAHTKVVSTKNDFFASYQSLVGQIQKDIENMKRYLK